MDEGQIECRDVGVAKMAWGVCGLMVYVEQEDAQTGESSELRHHEKKRQRN